MKFTIIFLLSSLFSVWSKKLFTFYNSQNNISHISIHDNIYRESGVFNNQEGHIYFRKDIEPYLVSFNGGYINYINMKNYLCIKSDRKYITTLYYPNKTKVIDAISLDIFGGEIINVFHMNFETYGKIDYSIKLYKNMNLIYNVQLNVPYVSWYLNDYIKNNEQNIVYDIVLENYGDGLVNCLECDKGYTNSYFWNLFLKTDNKNNNESLKELNRLGIDVNEELYHIYNIYEISK